MPEIILLGSSGFAGRHLTTILQNENKIPVVLYRSSDLDLLSRGAPQRLKTVLKSDSILIAAARAPQNPDEEARANQDQQIGENIAAGLSQTRIRKFIYLSTSAVYGETPYGRAKKKVEDALLAVGEKSGTPTYLLRICTIYGPGDHHPPYGPGRFIRSILNQGRVQIFGDGEEKRDYIFVRDLVHIASRFALEDHEPGIYDVAAQCASFQEILDLLRKVMEQDFTVESVERKIAKIDLCLDASKLKRVLHGLKFTELKEGLRETVRSFQLASSQ